MRTQIDHEKKQVIVWLTNAEQTDEAQRQELQRLYREYGANKYMVAVFHSGREDLPALTSHLLCHNRVCAAKAELRQAEAAQQQAEQKEDPKQVRERQEAYQGPTMSL